MIKNCLHRFAALALALILTFQLAANEMGIEEKAREKMLNLFSGEWVSRSLYVATKLGIADYLQSGPKSVDELAFLSKANKDALYRLLHMLAGFGVFEETSPAVFANTRESSLLVKTNPDTLHALSLWYGEDMHKSWDELLASIQGETPAFQIAFNQPVFSYLKDNPERAALFQDAMKEKSKAVIKSALSTYDFGRFASVYDIGGGYGQFMNALLQKYPHINGLLFELPEVIAKIKAGGTFQNAACKLSSGDFFISVPEGGDAYILKSVIHDWNDSQAELILNNCRKAMSQDARLLLVEVVLLPGELSRYANCMDILMLAVTGGKERNLASFTRMLDQCGFVLEKVYPTSTEFSILEARKK